MNKNNQNATGINTYKTMKTGSNEESLTRALIWALSDFGAELRLVDASHMISYVLRDSHDSIQDIISSSTELLFKEDTLVYCRAAEMSVDWDHSPLIILGMEFNNNGVIARFDLSLVGNVTDITLREIQFNVPEAPDMEQIDHLVYALVDARLKPMATKWSSRAMLN
ncbi:hypothetical protein [Cohaesibacter celericrescens]|uniref:Uncharacterized protein n=1 Tax=Cohaesibacter celericrescens TaxID=2067669 RepID=A0A2N5XM43_9HYPH|nr:hypothetical protein [Cohaesibacter celericrescens]PLW75497.1 hypothetical protein C0081_19345 [Cohaesibacter celericrescens]PLW78904.1 hypothetical protein C0081_01305 [Cohaesibacter celericrescens]